MKKLYCINAEYNIKCKKKELFNKNKDTLISRYIEDKYLVCDEKDIKQNTLDLIKKIIIDMNKKYKNLEKQIYFILA